MRLTERTMLELVLCVAQHFYYGKDEPILPDHVYDEIEQKYVDAGGELWVGSANEIRKRFRIERAS